MQFVLFPFKILSNFHVQTTCFLDKQNLLGSLTLVKRHPKGISRKASPGKRLGMFVGRLRHQHQFHPLWKGIRKILLIIFAPRSYLLLLLHNLPRGTDLSRVLHAIQRVFSARGSPSLCLVRLTPVNWNLK